ncbi:MAG TPA: tryptophan 2,3-dioxygenase family protein [Acidimicrobiia bacterium]|nr:tryptophan 2,3-dioxygenase family protein [Acidimicrobiia bacterium]
MSDPVLYYGDYLGLDELLATQRLESTRHGETVHDEMLFVIVHQSYELWFKQIIWELDSIRAIFSQDIVDEQEMGTVVSRLRRVNRIQGLLVEMVGVLETMTSLDFLDFRDHLFPASGFQSAQFRIVENKLGLQRQDRLLLSGDEYTARFDEDDRARVEATETESSLFELVERWLERTPFLDQEDFHFWEAYREAVLARIEADRGVVEANPTLSEEERSAQLAGFDKVFDQYAALFDPDKHDNERAAGRLRMSQRAFQAAVFITLYRDQPALQEAHRLLEVLMDVDEGFTTWRHRHAQMVLRMIGSRIGTGGSAGAKYLTRSAERSRVFDDLLNLSNFLVPRSDRPELPRGIVDSMRFRFER